MNIQNLLHQIEILTIDEQKTILTFLTQKMEQSKPKKQRRKLSDFRGSAPNFFGGEDAQEWISRLRSGNV
ncbi:MAG: hypothetical protein KAI83_00525 [Thiomargarita sp.]|nr:hypothetical protein [Thiomargarita sp.]